MIYESNSLQFCCLPGATALLYELFCLSCDNVHAMYSFFKVALNFAENFILAIDLIADLNHTISIADIDKRALR
jgi:hypothetical protein